MQITKMLDAVTADTTSSPVEFTSFPNNYTAHYDALIPSGQASLFLEWTWDGEKWFVGQKVTMSDNANGFIECPQALSIRARTEGLGAGRTITVRIARQ